MLIRNYNSEDETQWIRCRVLAFLDTSYYDSVYNKKETYSNKSVELIAEVEGKIIGMLDMNLIQKKTRYAGKEPY